MNMPTHNYSLGNIHPHDHSYVFVRIMEYKKMLVFGKVQVCSKWTIPLPFFFFPLKSSFKIIKSPKNLLCLTNSFQPKAFNEVRKDWPSSVNVIWMGSWIIDRSMRRKYTWRFKSCHCVFEFSNDDTYLFLLSEMYLHQTQKRI